MKKIKKWFLPITSSILGVSAISIGIVNNSSINSNEVTTQLNNFSKSKNINESSYPILSNNKFDVKQSTKYGFLSYDSGTIYLTSFLGDLVWSFDIAKSGFFANNALSGATISSLSLGYSNTNNIIGVLGQISNGTNYNGISSFYFQLNMDDGTPYFPNKDPSVEDSEKFKSYFLTNKKGLGPLVNKVSMDDNGNVFIFNQSTTLKHQSPNGSDGTIVVLDSRNLSMSYIAIDNSLVTSIQNYFLKNIVEVEKDVYVLVTIDNNTNPSKIQMNLINNSFTSIANSNNNIYTISGTQISESNIIWNPAIFNNSDGTKNIVLPIIGSNGKFIKFELRNKTISYGSEINVNDQIDYIDYDESNNSIYFTNSNGLNKYSLSSSASSLISNDEHSKNSKISIFNVTDNTTSLTNLVTIKDGIIKGLKNISSINNQTNLISVEKPVISDFNSYATQLKYNDKLAADLTNEDVIKLLNVSNLTSDKYNTELVKLDGTEYTVGESKRFVADNINGTIDFRFKLNIKNWWSDSTFYSRILPASSVNVFRKYNDMIFQLVTISSIDKNKYDKQQEILSTKYATDITSNEILEYFINQGKGVGITESDINIYTINESSQQIGSKDENKQINVKEDINTGIVTIEYLIKKNEGSTSIGESNIRGSAEFKTTKKLDDYKQISAETSKLLSLKKEKSVLDITSADLINVLSLSGGYSQKVNQWSWKQKNVNYSKEWINDIVNGNLNGTLSYIKDNNVPDKVLDSHLSVSFSSTNYGQTNVENGTGFLTLADKLGKFEDENLSNPFFEVDTALANSWSVTKNKEEISQEFGKEISKFVKTKNPWIDVTKLSWTIDESKSTDNNVHIVIQLQPNTGTNIQLSDGSNLVLTQDWVDALKANANSAKLFEPIEIDLGASLAVFEWKNDIGGNKTFSSASTKQANLGVNKLSVVLPSEYVDRYEKQDGIGYLDFQEKTQLLKLPEGSYIGTPSTVIANSTVVLNNSTTRQSDLSQFIVTNIDLVPDDENGIVTASYTLYYPKLNTYRVASLSLRGFTSINDIIAFWMVIAVLVAIILFSVWLAAHIIKKEKKKNTVFSTKEFYKNFKKVKEVK